MENAEFVLLIIACVLLIVANIHKGNLFYLLSLFAWLAYLIKPIKDDVEDIKTLLKQIKKCHSKKS